MFFNRSLEEQTVLTFLDVPFWRAVVLPCHVAHSAVTATVVCPECGALPLP